MTRNSHDGVVGQHDLLAHQSNEVAVGLDERRAAATQEPGFHLAHKSSQQRRQEQHQQHLPPWADVGIMAIRRAPGEG